MTLRITSPTGEESADLGDAVECAWCTAWASLGYDGTTQVDDNPQRLRVLTPSSPDLLLNAILRYRAPGTVTRAEVAAELAPYRAACRPPQWWLRLGTEPPGLRDSLYAAGMRVWGNPIGMALPLADAALPLDVPPDLLMGRARSYDDAHAALSIISTTFELDPAPMRRWCVGNPLFMTYLARQRGIPAAALVTQVRDGVAGFFQVSTLPRFRRRGIAHALMSHALRDAQSLGATTAALTASHMAESLYAHLGFLRCGTIEQWMPGPELMSAITYPARRR